ncbi:MAG: hypothetical protein JWL85_797 [Candidatus Saccharibacteria bacterium]|nr:hypothetical protein [Candidatus Saccharibacteria bacterium]
MSGAQTLETGPLVDVGDQIVAQYVDLARLGQERASAQSAVYARDADWVKEFQGERSDPRRYPDYESLDTAQQTELGKYLLRLAFAEDDLRIVDARIGQAGNILSSNLLALSGSRVEVTATTDGTKPIEINRYHGSNGWRRSKEVDTITGLFDVVGSVTWIGSGQLELHPPGLIRTSRPNYATQYIVNMVDKQTFKPLVRVTLL